VKKVSQISAVEQLHNLCNFLEDQKNDSPYSAEAWDELQKENDRLRVALAQIIKIHEDLARKYGELQSDLFNCRQAIFNISLSGR
jgi:hypothetical protein